MELEDLVHMVIKVERQLKRVGTRQRSFPQTSSAAPWRSNQPKKEEIQSMSKDKIEPKPATITTASEGKSAPTLNRNSEIRCFKCLRPMSTQASYGDPGKW